MTSYPIVGMYFRPPAKALLEVLPSGAELTLTPEPENQYDPNAIKVEVQTSAIPTHEHERLAELILGHGMELSEVLEQPSWHLGYIPKEIAADLAPQMIGPVKAKLGWSTRGTPVAQLP